VSEASLPDYNRQLTAGYSKNTISHGLIVFMKRFLTTGERRRGEVGLMATRNMANRKPESSNPLTSALIEQSFAAAGACLWHNRPRARPERARYCRE